MNAIRFSTPALVINYPHPVTTDCRTIPVSEVREILTDTTGQMLVCLLDGRAFFVAGGTQKQKVEFVNDQTASHS